MGNWRACWPTNDCSNLGWAWRSTSLHHAHGQGLSADQVDKPTTLLSKVAVELFDLGPWPLQAWSRRDLPDLR
jgi:hypothetical protein